MIPVFEPLIEEDDIVAVTDALRKGEISGSFGNYIPNFERVFADYVDCKHGIAVSSGTTALHLAVAAADVQAGDEVLISAATNIATALAVAHHNAIPVPIDSEPLTWNLDLDLVEQAITPRTKAIIPVHLYGHPVDMDKLMQIAQKHHLTVIEDAAEGHGALCRGKKIGSFGDMSCFSFYANKIITTGEGGMITTNNDVFADKMRLLRNLAFTKPRFKHNELGYNFRMTGMQAALGFSQTQKIERILAGKIKMATNYNKHLADLKALQLPVEMDWAKNVYWMYGIVLTEHAAISRDDLVERLWEAGIETRTFFCPMNLQPCLLKNKDFRAKPCPVAENLWERGLYLPSSSTLNEQQITFIAETIKKLI